MAFACPARDVPCTTCRLSSGTPRYGGASPCPVSGSGRTVQSQRRPFLGSIQGSPGLMIRGWIAFFIAGDFLSRRRSAPFRGSAGAAFYIPARGMQPSRSPKSVVMSFIAVPHHKILQGLTGQMKIQEIQEGSPSRVCTTRDCFCLLALLQGRLPSSPLRTCAACWPARPMRSDPGLSAHGRTLSRGTVFP